MRREIAAIVVLGLLAWAAIGAATLTGLADWLVPR